MTEETKQGKKGQKKGRKKSPAVGKYNRELQAVLEELPFGPISITKSKAYIQFLRHSVHYEGYPLPPLPTLRIEWILCPKWATKSYELGKGTILHNDITLKYKYYLIDHTDDIVTPLCTAGMISMITLCYGLDVMFSTNVALRKYKTLPILLWYGRYELQYRQYTEKLC